MFSKAVIATSLSETSDAIIGCLPSLQEIATKEILLVHAMNIHDVGGLYHEMERLSRPKLEQQKMLVESMGFIVDTEMPLGFPYLEINRIAAERKASLIIVHTKTRSIVEDYFVGGVAHDVINRALTPVLVLRAKIIEGAAGEQCEILCRDAFEHVLFPTDFSDSAERAFAYLEKIVQSTGAEVTLHHVQEKVRIEPHLSSRIEEFNQIDRDRLDRLKTRLLSKGAKTVYEEIAYGSSAGEIIKRAKQNTHSLIVVGSQGRGFIEELFLGSTSHQVLRHAPVPVLLIPRPR